MINKSVPIAVHCMYYQGTAITLEYNVTKDICCNTFHSMMTGCDLFTFRFVLLVHQVSISRGEAVSVFVSIWTLVTGQEPGESLRSSLAQHACTPS